MRRPWILRSKLRMPLTLSIVSILTLTIWGFFIEPATLTVKDLTVQIPEWPEENAGIKLALLGDLHVGAPFVGLDKLKTIVGRTNDMTPDLVVLLGDYVTRNVIGGREAAPENIAERLGELRAPLGSVAVLGNQDWWLDGPRVREALKSAGITVLENGVVRIDRAPKPFWLAGLNDATRHPDIKGALEKIKGDEPVILLSHNPDVFPQVPERVSLTLAAHTHGGQVLLPLLGRLIVPSTYGQRYAAGLVEEGGRQLFVTTGIGTSIIPVRFRVPPELVIVTLIKRRQAAR